MADDRKIVFKIETEADEAKKDVQQINKDLDTTVKKSREVERAATTLGSRLKREFGKVKSETGKLIDSLSPIGARMQIAGAKMTVATLPIAMGLKKSVNAAMELDTAIRKVRTLTDDNILPTEQLRKNIREISDETGLMQEEIAEGFYEALSSGLSSKDVTAFVRSGVKLTEAGFTNMRTAIDATTTVLNAYGDKAYDVSKIHDIFVQTQNLGKITVDQLANSIGRVIPTAQAANVNLDQLGAAYAILTARGQNAQIATTNLNSLLQELATTGSKSNRALLDSTGQNFKELMANGEDIEFVLSKVQEEAKKANVELSDMFGNANAQRAANSLFGSGFAEVRRTIQKSDGTTDKNYQGMHGDEKEWKKTLNEIRNIALDTGKDLLPLMRELAEIIKGIAQAYNSLSPEAKNRVAKGLAISAVAGPATTLAGSALRLGGGLLRAGGKVKDIISPKAVDGILAGAEGLQGAAAAGGEVAKTSANIAGQASKVAAEGAKATGTLAGLKGILAGLGAPGILGGLGALAGIGGIAYANTKLEKEKPEVYKRNVDTWNKYSNMSSYDIYKDTMGSKVKSHKLGLTEVPHDNYKANLHKGERVLTKEEAREYSRPKEIQTSTTTISPHINITVQARENQDTVDVARAVKNELDSFFRNLRLQRV